MAPPCLPERNSSIQEVQNRLHQIMKDQMHGAGTSSAIAPGVLLPGVCTALTLIRSIEEVAPGFMLSEFLPHMVRLLGRLAGGNDNIQGHLLARKEQPVSRTPQRLAASHFAVSESYIQIQYIS